MFKLFDACVTPILLYGSEIWGYECVDILEKVHSRFCKLVTRSSKFKHNTMVYAELGRFPISILIKLRMINFWNRIVKGKESKISHILYRILLNLDRTDRYKSAWLSYIRNIFESCGLGYVWLSQGDDQFDGISTRVKSILHDQYLQEWRAKINNEEDFVNYRIFKDTINLEGYLEKLPENLAHVLFDFRTGYSKLPVNDKNNLALPRNERMCKKCNANQIGDEFHFLFECNKLVRLRNEFIPRYYRTRPNTIKFHELFNVTQKRILLKLSCFIVKGKKEYALLPDIM